ncbi:NADH dehydrogenase (ubiquinone) 1 alpha subcomplex 8 [Microbotryum lychnidis-dioicae p1A1 Lamole]|uniref:NADH-ubiquinone oxidoreductase n=1 Tax=Microbotryum lychnidis-dioicae (strain p1A1 Lamole / MvSl-1064) TaxID=683840 RepID=U5HG29_USTV1|nr:NADH dehydrogenase (ubiquinone) 1 alpha subcomplex 8 [Microbotryum lychnidis-dioicae p1A1 Lamole]|eukprot:KDE03488.1 NADH dehydrogenase (ubiquinone) 1 alpha subcomplex 8 [Microbotryum lychnidis-dioicae p1A1 Lamole]
MSTHREAKFPDKDYVEPTPMPSSIPHVDELGVTSAPLKSASFFIGEHCQKYNEDFMLCKAEDRNPEHCLKEGRKVTRCAQDLITKVRSTCLAEFNAHWECLERNNQEFYLCRKPERVFNSCVFEKLKLAKNIPGSPEDRPQIHDKTWPIYGPIQK